MHARVHALCESASSKLKRACISGPKKLSIGLVVAGVHLGELRGDGGPRWDNWNLMIGEKLSGHG